MRLPGRLATLLLAGILVAGCGTAATEDAGDPTPSADPSTPASRPQDSLAKTPDEAAPVPETLAFSATTVGGEAFEGASLAGRPTLLWFWAPWCPTCRSQISQVESLASTYDGELHVIGVGSLDSAEAIAEFAGDVDGVTHLEDTEGALFRRFGIAEQSSFVLLDADGQVAFETGYGGSDDLDQQVEGVLG